MKRFLVFVCLVAICVYGLYRWTEYRSAPGKYTPASGAKLSYDDVRVLETMEEEYTKLVQVVVPSVVSITATRRVEAPQQVENPLDLFFGRRFRQPRQTEEMRSLGSGVIVAKEGYIVTNQHVVADVDEVSVRLSNGQEAKARIIGSDKLTDIAVLKVTGLNVTALPFADSDQVKVGQWVIAVGNPFGFDETVTEGIISAKGRAMEDSANEFFQTNAAINPGNSGGPLVNLRGEMIGINSSIYAGSGSGSWQGLGFAIPSNTVRRALEAILKTGHVPHGYLGVTVLSPDLLARLGLPEVDGAYVYAVTPGSPADKAGIRKGDVITSVGSHPIHNFSELRTQIAGAPTDAPVGVGLTRAGQTMMLTAQTEEPPAAVVASNQPVQPVQPPDGGAPPPAENPGLLAGVHVTEIPADRRAELPAHAHGVMVAGVDQGSAAAGTLQAGDVIEEVNRAPVQTVQDYQQAAAAVTGDRVLLSICHGKRRSFAVITAQ